MDADTSAGRDPVAGARNLLLNCAGARAGESLLILAEPAGLGMYGEGLDTAFVAAAAGIGLSVSVQEVGFSPVVADLPANLARAISEADHALFLARLGDQLRFSAALAGARPVVSYALDTEMLGSGFGRADYRVFLALKAAIDGMIAAAGEIRVTCPLGTDFRGAVRNPGHRPPDTTVRRFPMSVHSPVPAGGFEGRIALSRFLVGTGSNYYEPYGLPLEGVLFAEVAAGRLRRFDGAPEQVTAAQAHYENVAARFGIDAGAVHSWHGGIHPGCSYPMPAAENFERWSGGAFGNPRLVHFHTCGDYAPGEICWNLVDPTVTVDGIAILEGGTLKPQRVPGGAEILERCPDVAELFDRPAQDIGL